MRFAPRLPLELPDYLSCPQLAELLGVSPGTVRNWCREGRLPNPIVLSDRIKLYSTKAVRRTLARAFPELIPAGEEEGQAAANPAPVRAVPAPPAQEQSPQPPPQF